MKERPILFNGDMVRAILSGEKTQTRRMVDIEKLKGILRYSVRGDSIFAGIVAKPGAHNLAVNSNFAVSVSVGEKKLGLRPGEFNFLCPFAGECTATVEDGKWILVPIEPSRLWVRESATVVERIGGFRKATIRYEADGAIETVEYPARLAPIPCVGYKLANGTYREASRITLEIVRVRVERLQWIDDKNSGKEGICFYKYSGPYCDSGKLIFKQLWNSIYKNWDENPWVWVVEFKRVQQ